MSTPQKKTTPQNAEQMVAALKASLAQHSGTWSTVLLTVSLRIPVEGHPEDAALRAEQKLHEALSNEAWSVKVVGADVNDVEVSR